MPAADDQVFFDYDPVKAKELLDASSWDKSKPLRIVYDKSFAGVEQWAPIMQQNLEAIGFKVELMGLDTTAAIEMYDKIDQFDVTIAQGGAQGVGPFASQIYFSCKQTEPAHFKTYSRNCAIDEGFVAARKELDPSQAEGDLQERQQADQQRDREGLLVDHQRAERQGQEARGGHHPAGHP